MMDVGNLSDKLEDAVSNWSKPITVHTGGNNWEAILDVVYCQECDQYHIISERVPLEGSTILDKE